ncbi:MAG: formate dehydrogenase subunit gamma [Hyphomicrobiaceae bacterium]
MSGTVADVSARTTRILAAFEGVEAPLIEILHAVQKEFGCVPPDSQRLIAERLNLSRAEIHGVVTFYHDFRMEPGGRHTLKICRAEACQSMGGDAHAVRAAEVLGVDFGSTTADGGVTLEAVYCLGFCACAPAAMLDGVPVGRVDRERLDALLAEARR